MQNMRIARKQFIIHNERYSGRKYDLTDAPERLLRIHVPKFTFRILEYSTATNTLQRQDFYMYIYLIS